MTMRGTFAICTAAAMLVVAVGCGGDDSDPEEEAVRDTYLAYIDAVKAGEGEKACALTTPEFQRRVGASIAIGPRAGLRGASCPEVLEKGSLPQLQLAEPELEDIEINGDRASGLDPGETVGGAEEIVIGPQEVFFERLGGDWKISKTAFFRVQQSG